MTKQEKMYGLIEEQQASGQTAKAFCQQRQIKLGTFNYWLRKKNQISKSALVALVWDPDLKVKPNLFFPNEFQYRRVHFVLHQFHHLSTLDKVPPKFPGPVFVL